MEAGDDSLAALEESLQHRFATIALLEQAVTHSSARQEQSVQALGPVGALTADNERLEFLGDAVVGLLVAEALYLRFPGLSEGELTQLRAALVSRKHLGEIGGDLDLGRWLRLSRGEERSGGRKKQVLLANCLEAVTAALYLDTGTLHVARAFVLRVIVEPKADELYRQLRTQHTIGDYKSALQEFLQARALREPEYVVKAETGPDHRKRFTVEARMAADGQAEGRALATGTGTTKKKAEQEAAQKAYRRLTEREKREGISLSATSSQPRSDTGSGAP